MQAQERISQERNSALVGRILPVLCDGPSAETEHLLEGRTEGQAPEVDGKVWINDGAATAGEIVPVEITEAHPFDLVGRSLRDSSPAHPQLPSPQRSGIIRSDG